MAELFRTVEDGRMVIDIVAAGFNKSMVTVKSARVNGGDTFKIIVEGKYAGRTNADGKAVPAVAFEKKVSNFKISLSDNAAYGADDYFSDADFNTKDYDLDKLAWDCKNGVIRIAIPKTEIAVGKAVEATDNADADSTGVTTDNTSTED